MKQLLTIFMLLLVSVAYTQRPEPTAQEVFDANQARVGFDLKEENGEEELDLDTLYPGNWLEAAGFANYIWGEGAGFFFGTNIYADQGYAQHFPVDAPYELYGAFYWFGAAAGTAGNVRFTIWEFDGEPGNVIAQTDVPLADIEPSTSLWPDEEGEQPGALYVDFTDEDGNPIEITGDYAIGADIMDLDPFVDGVNQLGNISTQIGEGDQRGLAWIWETTGWIKAVTYTGGHLDIGVIPLIFMEFDVHFNVDMTNATIDGAAFDPDAQVVYLTGSLVDWAEPGTVPEYQMEAVLDHEPQVFYHEAFEEGMPGGWYNVDANEDGYSWNIVTRPSYDPVVGDYAAMSQSWTQQEGDVDPDNWLVTPLQNIGYGDNELHFNVKAQDAAHPAEKYSVMIATEYFFVTEMDEDGEPIQVFTPDVFTEIHTETLSGGGWQDVTVSLSDYEGEYIYIAFRHWDCPGNFELLLDNIRIEGTPPMIYRVSLGNDEIHLGAQEYKYFVGEGWDGGEWEGDPNRGIIIEGEMSTHDTWGHPDIYDVVFELMDEAGDPIEDAIITFNEVENDPGEYAFESIIGEFEYAIEAEGYHPVMEEITVTGNHHLAIELQKIRTLDFIVEDADGDLVEGLMIVMYDPDGAFLGDEYSFENLRAGVHYDYFVTDYMADAELQGIYVNQFGSLMLPADVEETAHEHTVVMHHGYEVEFNVDMSEATFEHYETDVDFNPDVHDLYVSVSATSWAAPDAWPGFVLDGEMTSWPVPGSNEAQWLGYQMTDDDGDGIFTSSLLNLLPAEEYEYKYYVVQNNVPGWMHPEYEEEGHNRIFTVVDHEVELHDVWGTQPYEVTFNVNMTEAYEDGDFDPESDVVYITGSYNYWAEPGTQKNTQELIQIPDTLVYTITIPITSGDHEYKYFVNEGWEHAEWDGDPNRDLVVMSDMTVVDMFGDITYDTGFITDLSLEIFPNPARDQVTVNSSEMINTVEVYNLTGHRLREINPNDHSVQVNVSGLGMGVYIMRIHTANGVANHKFQVIN